MVMAAWNPDDWTPPETFGSFPAYYRIIEERELDEVSSASQSVLIPQSDKENLEAEFFDLEDVDDWFWNAAHLLKIVVEYPDVRSRLL